MALCMVDCVLVRHHKTGLCRLFPRRIVFTRRDMRVHCFCTQAYLYNHQTCNWQFV